MNNTFLVLQQICSFPVPIMVVAHITCFCMKVIVAAPLNSTVDFVVLLALAAAYLLASDARSHLSAATTPGAQHQPSWTSSTQRSRLTVALPALKT